MPTPNIIVFMHILEKDFTMIIALSSQRLPEEHSGTGKVFLVGRDSVPLVNSSMTRLSQSSLPTFRTHHFFKSFCSGRYLLRRGMFTCCTNSAFKGVDEMRTSFVFSGSCNRFALFLGPDGRTSNSNPAREPHKKFKCNHTTRQS